MRIERERLSHLHFNTVHTRSKQAEKKSRERRRDELE
jgi:hypothetical protein